MQVWKLGISGEGIDRYQVICANDETCRAITLSYDCTLYNVGTIDRMLRVADKLDLIDDPEWDAAKAVIRKHNMRVEVDRSGTNAYYLRIYHGN
jgi:hypothetical protein